MLIKIILLFCLLILAGYFLFDKADFERYSMLKKEEYNLRHVLELKRQRIVNASHHLKKKNADVNETIKLFTTKQEIPWLLETISKTGKSSGLLFDLLSSRPEIHSDFYSELPIEMSLVGTYQQITDFLSRVAKIRLLVTWHDFIISRDKSDDSGELLRLKITAKIYRYHKND